MALYPSPQHQIVQTGSGFMLIKNMRAKMALYNSPEYQTSFNLIGLSVQENKFKIDLQDGSCGGHLGFLIQMILAIFSLQITPILPTKFQVN